MKKLLTLLAFASILSAGSVDWSGIPKDQVTELNLAETTVFVYERRNLSYKAQDPQKDYADLRQQLCAIPGSKDIHKNPYIFMYVFKDGYIINRIDNCQ